jgi:hypothetical protein
MSAVVHARVTEQPMRLRLLYVAERLDAELNEAVRAEPTYLDFLDAVPARGRAQPADARHDSAEDRAFSIRKGA